MILIATVASTITLAAAAAPSQDAAAEQLSIHADKVYTSVDDAPIENALIVVEDGKIVAISPGVEAPRDAVKAAVVTAGMVDASARINTGFTSVEQSNEVTPAMDVRYGIDFFDVRWDRLVRSGVTTAFIAPLNRNCIGGVGRVVKTTGEHDVKSRIVEGDLFVCGAIGSSPSSGNSPAFGPPSNFYARRPTTRMGVEWEWRQALFNAAQAESDAVDQNTQVLQDVLSGKAAVHVEAWATQDIRTAVFLKEEMQKEGFGTMRLVIDAAAEAWREPAMLARTESAVILPPFPSQGRTRENALMPLDTPKKLQDAGVRFALSAHDAGTAAARLHVQAGLAMRGGLTREAALRAVTIEPARILGVQKRVGSVEAGKDADLVLWNGEPFEITSRPVGVVAGGKLVVDPR